MLQSNEWILLKAIFNPRLHQAVMDKNIEGIQSIIDKEYTLEVMNGFIQHEEINIEQIHQDHKLQIQDEDLVRSLL